MSLETEIKKLREAVEANTAALGSTASQPAAVAAPVAAVPQVQAPASPPVVPTAQPAPTPAAVAPTTSAPQVTYTKEDVLKTLPAVIQKQGGSQAGVEALLQQEPFAASSVSEVNPNLYPQLIAAAQLLVQ